MRRSAGVDGARLHNRPRPPSEPAFAAGVHELAAVPPPVRALGAAPRPREAVLFVPENPASTIPLLVFFHGAGGAGASSLALVRRAAAASGCAVLLPTSTDSTWDVIAGGWGIDVTRLDAALDVVFDHLSFWRVAFGGFSDGASYALSIGLANGDLAEAVLAFSPGFAAPPHQVGRPRVFISHGTQDAVLPVDRCGRVVARQMRSAGYDVSYEEFHGPHVVPGDTVLRAVRWWLDGDRP